MESPNAHDIVAQAQVRNQRARANRKIGLPAVGIFWLLPDRLLTSVTELEDAQDYGALKISRCDHLPYWRTIQRMVGSLGCAIPNVIGYPYEFWPRGRVSYDTRRGTFLLLADEKILRNVHALDEIFSTFCLPLQRTQIRGDEHYSTYAQQ